MAESQPMQEVELETEAAAMKAAEAGTMPGTETEAGAMPETEVESSVLHLVLRMEIKHHEEQPDDRPEQQPGTCSDGCDLP